MFSAMRLVPATCLVLALSLPAAAATVRVHIDRGPYTGPIELQLAPSRPDDLPRWISAQRVAADATDAAFGPVAAGAYIVLASGPQPLQRATAKVVVGADDTRQAKIVIPQRSVDGRISLGGKPLAGASVRIQSEAFNWSTETVTDADGAIRGPMWEAGTFNLAIYGGGLPSLVRWGVTLGREPKATFSVDIPARRIRGVIVDDRGPVEGALVILRSKLPGPTNVRTRTGKDGVFEYVGIRPGKHTLDVISNGHLLGDPIDVEARADDAVVERRIVLARGTPRNVTVVDQHGSPVADALVACTSESSVRSVGRTDDAGRAVLATTDDSIAWAAPADGSIGVVRLDRETSAVKITAARAASSLNVHILSTDGKGIPNVMLLMRYNGFVIPPALQQFLPIRNATTNDEGQAMLTHIPAGVWEIWPYSSTEESEALIASALPLAPININVVTGENEVTVHVRKNR